jgi:molybdate/tungstate transport system substrate-binding protein
MKIVRITAAFLVLSLVALCFGCSNAQKGNNKVIVFHAGSLSLPLKEMATKYMELNPGVTIELEGAGSVACARKIIDLEKPCDIMASADYSIIDKMLIPEYAAFNIQFARNSMVIAYTDKSRSGDSINLTNWIDILLDKDVIYGRSDPDSDPCGYRSVLTMKLAEKYYERPGITNQVLAKDVNMMRPKEVDLLALLETGVLDYIFIYKSVALQHSLSYLELPPEIDLSDPELDKQYASVSVDIKGSGPGDYISIPGQSMIYGITLLNNAPNREEAIRFLSFILGEEGRSIIDSMGQKLKSPPITSDLSLLPEQLRKYCTEEDKKQ